jgi:hypothetical protein
MNPTDPAFPVPETEHYIANGAGMDLRTYMATQFLAAAIAKNGGRSCREIHDVMADDAANQADALIARLNAK